MREHIIEGVVIGSISAMLASAISFIGGVVMTGDNRLLAMAMAYNGVILLISIAGILMAGWIEDRKSKSGKGE
jgi:hypothetical protein